MATINIKGLLKEANKYIKNPDNIIDPYDMAFVYVSKKLKKLHGKNFENTQISSLVEDAEGKKNFEKMDLNAVTIDYKVKEKKIIIQTKPNEKRKALINYVVIKFDNQPYLVTKMIKMED